MSNDRLTPKVATAADGTVQIGQSADVEIPQAAWADPER
jgi:hypothetical protein